MPHALTLNRWWLSASYFYSICKPRVTALIVFTAAISLYLAAPQMLAASAIAAALIGITFISGASAALNGLLEKKIDRQMVRTHKRPLASERLAILPAVVFATALGTAGFLLLYRWVNPITAAIAVASLVGYSVVYTLILKSRTKYNIVLGGIAGAMPPILGWTSATGSIGEGALLLFLIIFLWTPPHFWALALYYRDDYARAGIPMLPVVEGDDHTRKLIVFYVVILIIASLTPFIAGISGVIYLGSAILLGAKFFSEAYVLYSHGGNVQALRVFKYSVLYLFLLFLALALDHFFLSA